MDQPRLTTAGALKDDAELDVVFVHGLGGSGDSTWTNQADQRWPDLFAALNPRVNVRVLDYPAAATKWLSSGEGLVVSELGRMLIDYLSDEGLGVRPIVWVGHSLGGLVIKQLLRSAAEYGNDRHMSINTATASILFLATPHAGSTRVAEIDRALLRPTRTTKALEADAPELLDLDIWFRNNADDYSVRAFQETVPPFTGTGKGNMRGNAQLVVQPSSADPGIKGCTPAPVHADHFSIAKPSSANDPTFLALASEVRSAAPAQPKVQTATSHLLQFDAEVPSATVPELKRFFDGYAPTYSTAVDQRVPRRSVVSELVGRMTEALDGNRGEVVLLTGPVGEGKTTALYQAAHALALDGHPILLVSESELDEVTSQALEGVGNRRPVLVCDDAALHADAILQLVMRDGSDIHVMGASSERDWKNAGASRLRWRGRLATVDISPLTLTEAEEMVGAWAAADTLGELSNISEAERPDALHAASEGKRSTLLGALLAVKFTSDGLRDHLRDLVESLPTPAQREALLMIGVIEACTTEGIHRDVLATLLGLTSTELHATVVRPLGQEAFVSTGGVFMTTRHNQIARGLTAIGASHWEVDVVEVLSAAAIQSQAQFSSQFIVSSHRRGLAASVHSTRSVVERLPAEDFNSTERRNVARQTALRLFEAYPNRLDIAVTAVTTLRALGTDRQNKAAKDDLEDALSICGEVAAALAPTSFADFASTARGFLQEFGALAGALDAMHADLAITLLAISDDLKTALTKKDLMLGLAACGSVSIELARSQNDPFARSLAASIHLATLIGGHKYLERYRKKLAPFETDVLDTEDALDALQAAYLVAAMDAEPSIADVVQLPEVASFRGVERLSERLTLV